MKLQNNITTKHLTKTKEAKQSRMTKCTIIGDTTSSTKKPTPIQFIKHVIGDVTTGGEWITTILKPEDWDNIELICKGDGQQFYDIMFVYDGEDRSNGILVLGWWNDGVV
jgi:hypothetical protein